VGRWTGRKVIPGFENEVSEPEWIFLKEFVGLQTILSYLQRFLKTATTGRRNLLDEQFNSN